MPESLREWIVIRFFYEPTLGHWTVLDLARPPRDKKLPTVLSRDEVRRVLAAIEVPAYRVCATTIYSCGLRRLEAVGLRGRCPVCRRGQQHPQRIPRPLSRDPP